MSFAVAINEEERLQALRGLDILDTKSEPAFDDLCLLAANEFKVQYALITLIDADRQWFKAIYGLHVCETPRDQSFCNHVVVNDQLLIVPDATLDERFSSNPLVLGPPYIKFYAGAPLYYGLNIRLGALCIIDQSPRLAEDVDVALLRKLADRVAGEIWLRQFKYEADLDVA